MGPYSSLFVHLSLKPKCVRFFTPTVPGPSDPVTPVEGGPEQETANLTNHQNAGKQGNKAHVQPHVAVKDVAELVGNNALEFVP